MAYSFRAPHHLPNRRSEGDPADPYELPRQRRGITPQMHGRYPEFNVLEQAHEWDEVTRKVVLDRVERTPEIRFFTPVEARALGAFCDVVTAQGGEPRIPVLAMVDEKLFRGKLDGYQYADMPDDRDTWRVVARGLDEAARQRGAEDFELADQEIKHGICADFAKGKLTGGVWDELPVHRAFSVVMRAVLAEFYSHPWAWNEIGFGGPAYPRGYMRLGIGQREPWEGDEAFVRDPVPDVKDRGLEGGGE